MENSKIEWTHHTFNPWIGCAKVSPGCAHCYAETLMDTRYGRVKWGKGQPRSQTSAANWKKPRQWNRQAEISNSGWRAGISLGNTEKELLDRGFIKPHRPRVFCASLADWLDDEVPIEWLADLMRLIHETPNLDWLLLTKRPQNFSSRIHAAIMEAACGSLDADNMMSEWEDGTPPANVWVGTTVEDQQRADERIPLLFDIPAVVRFLSCEPLLEDIDLSAFMGECCTICDTIQRYNFGIDWIICGGESGPGARPMEPMWARSLRNESQTGGAAFFFKQWGGNKSTGRILDGRTWDEIPPVNVNMEARDK
jgi:protein gp37